MPVPNGHLRPREPFVPLNGCVSLCVEIVPLPARARSSRRRRCRAARVVGAAACGPRELGAHARRPQPCSHAGEHRVDGLPSRLDSDDPAARLVHERPQGEGLRQYRLRGPPSAFQEDHLISLELGGDPVDPRNLWPEPYPRAVCGRPDRERPEPPRVHGVALARRRAAPRVRAQAQRRLGGGAAARPSCGAGVRELAARRRTASRRPARTPAPRAGGARRAGHVLAGSRRC